MPTPNVDTDEILYRQIGPGGNPIYFDPARTPVVHQVSFLPTPSDQDGLSLIRSKFRTEVWSSHRLEKPAVRFRLATLLANRLQQLALDLGFQAMSYVVSADSLDNKFGEPWAHCVVVEINRANYDSDLDARKRIKEWAVGVSRIITSNEVIGPFHEPRDDDPYRPTNTMS